LEVGFWCAHRFFALRSIDPEPKRKPSSYLELLAPGHLGDRFDHAAHELGRLRLRQGGEQRPKLIEERRERRGVALGDERVDERRHGGLAGARGLDVCRRGSRGVVGGDGGRGGGGGVEAADGLGAQGGDALGGRGRGRHLFQSSRK